jgi:drug/metabolite transporter (DMT)-like permease
LISSSDLRKGTAIAGLSAVSFALAVIFIRYAYRAGVSPGAAVFLRFALASATLVLFVKFTGRWIKLPRRQIIIFFWLGFLAYTVLGTTWFVALSITPVWLVSLIGALYPLAVNISSWLFLKEPGSRQQGLALAAVLLGTAILFWRPLEAVAWTGVILMILNVLVNTTYVLVGQRWTRRVPPLMSTTWIIIGAMAGTFCYAWLSGQLSFAFAPTGWLWVGFFAVISTALAIVSLWWSIGLIGPARVAIIGSFEPLCSILLAVLVLGERLLPLQLVGGVFILAGILLVQWQPQH